MLTINNQTRIFMVQVVVKGAVHQFDNITYDRLQTIKNRFEKDQDQHIDNGPDIIAHIKSRSIDVILEREVLVDKLQVKESTILAN